MECRSLPDPLALLHKLWPGNLREAESGGEIERERERESERYRERGREELSNMWLFQFY